MMEIRSDVSYQSCMVFKIMRFCGDFQKKFNIVEANGNYKNLKKDL